MSEERIVIDGEDYVRLARAGVMEDLPLSQLDERYAGSDPTLVYDKTYVHHQDQASDTWTMDHLLGKNPSVVTIDTSGKEVLGAVVYETEGARVRVEFSAPMSGKAYCN